MFKTTNENSVDDDKWYPGPPPMFSRRDVVLVGGCFDLMHRGHLHLFKSAKSLGAKVYVGVLSDNYVRKYKGSGRPIQDEKTRYEIVKSLRYVDKAFIVNGDAYAHDVLAHTGARAIILGVHNGESATIRKKAQIINYKNPNLEVLFLKRLNPDKISTTKLVEKI